MTTDAAERAERMAGIRQFLADTWQQEGTLEERRAMMDEATRGAVLPDGVAVTPIELAGRPAERLVPDGVPTDRGVLYLHGGAYCIGSLDSHRQLAARLADHAGLTVWVLDYRLAPEHPFPAAVDDAVGAYRELLATGIPAAALTLAGDSAGGGLTVATLLALRDRGVPLPAAGACLSPWADLTQTAAAYDDRGPRDPMITRDGLTMTATAYLGGADPTTPLASPVFAELHALPPLRIDVGEDEALYDDAITLAERARAAGVAVELHSWPDMIHVFQAFPPEIVPEGDESLRGIADFLAAAVSATRA